MPPGTIAVRRWAAMSDPVKSPSPRPTRVDTWETDLIGGSVTRDLLLRLPPWRKEGLLTTISTTIVPNSGTFAAVRRRSIYCLTCEDVLRQTGANPQPTRGGQGVISPGGISPPRRSWTLSLMSSVATGLSAWATRRSGDELSRDSPSRRSVRSAGRGTRVIRRKRAGRRPRSGLRAAWRSRS
jgi:hypothetical protein